MSGPIADGDLVATVASYASGTFSFTMDVVTADGASTASVSGLPFKFKVAPGSPSRHWSRSGRTPRLRQMGLSRSPSTPSRSMPDGSEFVSEVSVTFEAAVR